MSTEARTRLVCDFCGEDAAETWHFAHGPFRVRAPFTPLPDVVGEAGKAGACAGCKPLVEARDAGGLYQRAIERPPLASSPVACLGARLMVEALLGALTPGAPVVHHKLGEARPARDRFFTNPCPDCGALIPFDREAAEPIAPGGSVLTWKGNCPKCGLVLFAGPVVP